ncbi:MAG: 16S rRNA (uracil(1498)-N(3))-methyltransferase [Desulfuromonadales bacterium]|nr:16S rRNA (uracil(1498)-N(3))-methyltransferase [Desulfuromonadales bacterium]
MNGPAFSSAGNDDVRRFFVPAEQLTRDRVHLPADIAHHISRVLRLKAGTEIALLDGRGTLCRCLLETTAGQHVTAIIQGRHTSSETALPIDLCQGLPKADKMELILQKGTELGIRQFVPFISERVIDRKAAERGEKRLERWRLIVREAARQSHRLFLPEVVAPLPLSRVLADCTAELKLLLWEDASQPLATALPAPPPRSVALLIGPEGGFSAAEAGAARQAGFIPVGCGPRILRTETAGFTVATILQYLYGDLQQLPKVEGDLSS